MAELMFKRGLQVNLPSVAEDGCFYLTTDSNRLYVGREDNTMALLNQTVQIVDTIETLIAAAKNGEVHENDFYYCTSENVLAVYNGYDWVQINPDTNTNDFIEVSDVTFDSGVLDEEAGTVTYTLTLNQNKYNVNDDLYTDEQGNSIIDPITATLVLSSGDITKIVPDAASVGLEAKNLAEDGGVSINTSGTGADEKELINLVPGENIAAITADDNGNITIDAQDTTYTFTVEDNDESSVKLVAMDELNSEPQEVIFQAGEDLTVESSGDNTVIYNHKIYETESVSVTVPDDSLAAGDSFEIISGITLSNGHVVDIATDSITLPDDTHLIEGVEHVEDSWQATLTDTNSDTWVIDFSTDAANLRDALSEEIRKGLAAANTALTYKGVISDPIELESKIDVEVGDVYLLNANITTDEISYRVGDLFIATSATTPDSDALGDQEGFDGVITDIEWAYVPSGNEMIVDTFFKGQATVEGVHGVSDDENNGHAEFHITAEETAAGDDNTPEDNQGLTIIAGKDLQIVNNTETGSNEKVATIRHRDIETEVETLDDSTGAFAIPVITDITYDNGHITGLSKQTFEIATYELVGNADDNAIELKNSSEDIVGSIEVKGDDTWITATVEVESEQDKKYSLTVSHGGPGEVAHEDRVENDEDTQLAANGTLNIISGINYDQYGHVISTETQALQLPDDTTYDFQLKDEFGNLVEADGSESDPAVANPVLTLIDKDDNPDSIQMYSEHSNIEIGGRLAGETPQVTFSLVWGSFD